MNERDELMTAREVGELFGFGPRWALERARRNELPSFKLGDHGQARVRFPRAEVLARLEEWRRGARPVELSRLRPVDPD